MWSLLWTRLGRRAIFWVKLIIFSSVIHFPLLFFILFVYSGQSTIFAVQINRSILKSSAPIVFLPPSSKRRKVVSSGGVKRAVGKKSVAMQKKSKPVIAKKVPVKKTTIAKKKEAVKRNISKKTVAKKASIKKITPPKKKNTPAKKNPVKKKSVTKKTKPSVKKLIKASQKKKIAKKQEKIPDKKIKEVVKPAELSPEVISTQVYTDQQPVYLGQKEIEQLTVEYQIECEIKKHWRPPAGLSKDLTCTIRILVDWNGKSRQIKIEKPSGALMYDISVRTAVAKLQLPKGFQGKEISITFNQ